VNKENVSFKQMLLKCLPFTQSGAKTEDKESPISAVRLQLSVNDIKGCRKVALKGLYGDQALLKQFIDNFRARTVALVNKQTNKPTPRNGTQRIALPN
jgi:hypothetical protein